MKLRRVLLPWTVLGLFALQIEAQLESFPPTALQVSQDAEPMCNDVTQLPADQDKCAFAKAHCQADGLINYLTLYYCHVQHWGIIPATLLIISCIAALVLLFRIIGRTADEYFSAILSQISQEMGLPPRLGGVTLLALGNGAPDLSSTIAAVRTGDYRLALGALTGAAMFVGCVVAGRIVVLSGGVKARPAQIRDVLSLLVAVVLVTCMVATGKFTYISVGSLLALYVVYVIVVAVADFTKRAGVEWTEVGMNLSRKVGKSFSFRRGRELTAPLLLEETTVDGGGNDDAVLTIATSSTARGADGLTAPSIHNSSGGGSSGEPHVQQAAAVHGQKRGLSPRDRIPSNGSTESVVEMSAVDAPTIQSASAFSGLPAPTTTTVTVAGDGGLSSSSGNEIVAANISNSGGGSGTRRAETLPANLALFPTTSTTANNDNNNGITTATAAARRSATVSVLPDILDTPSSEDTLGSHSYKGRYGELVHMSAKEYRQRALADMAASKSFRFGRRLKERNGTVNVLDGLDEDEEEESEDDEGDEEQLSVDGGALERGEYEPPAVLDAASLLQHQQHHQQHHPAQSLTGGGYQYRHTETAQQKLDAEPVFQPTGLNKLIHDSIHTTTIYLDKAVTPVLHAMRCTIPIVEESAYNRQYFLIAGALAPLFVCFYLGAFSWKPLLMAMCFGAIGVAIAFLGTENLDEQQPPTWAISGGFPIGAAVVAVYGFAIAAMWIDVIASEIVGLLHFMGILAKIEPAVLGVSVLAWGNSLMDYMGNTSMAMKSAGGTSMAMTACYAGPLFNLLVGLGVGFWTLFVDERKTWAVVSFDPVVVVGCVFLMVNCVGITVVALRRKHWLSIACGWAMMGWYAAYIIVVIVVVLVT